MITFVTGHGIGNQIQALPALQKTIAKYGEVTVFVSGCNVELSRTIFGHMAPVTNNLDDVLHSDGQVLMAPCQDHPLPLNPLFVRTIHMISGASEVEANIRAVHPATYKEDFRVPLLPIEPLPAPDVVFANGYSKQDVARWQAKEWPYYRDLAVMLKGAGLTVGSLGSTNEYVEGTENLTGRSFSESLGILKGSKVLVANDIGLYHAACVVGTPCCVIFTFTDPVKNYDPRFHEDTTVIRRDLTCSPCMKGIGGDAVWVKNRPKCQWACRDIRPEQVLTEVMRYV